ncbi:MAG: PASTA domain-containing protein [Alistipes sp.]|nr:PASTA domain-containing protein [Alistipes sp.]
MMDFLVRLAQRINRNVITRNLVLAGCGLIVFVCVVNLLLNLFTRHGQVRQVPNLSGMTVEEALHAGDKASLRIEVNDSLYVPSFPGGVILEQTPAEGAQVKSGRRIFVTINSFHQKRVVVPYVTGYSLRQAKNNIETAGLEIKELIYREDIATNNVLEERCNGKLITRGSKIEAEMGSGVTLVVGEAGATSQKVPKTVGFSIREAKSRLWELGFNVGKITRDKGITPMNEHEAKVYVQQPTAGRMCPLGTRVDLSVTLDEQKLKQGHSDSDRAERAAAKALADSLDSVSINDQP